MDSWEESNNQGIEKEAQEGGKECKASDKD